MTTPPPRTARDEQVEGVELDRITDATESRAAGEIAELHRRVRRIAAENQRLFQQIGDGEQRVRRLAKSVWRGQEKERRRLARELHDGVGQTLTALKNHLQHLAQTAAEDDRLATRLQQAVELTAGALEETRQLSRLLRPPVLDDLGLEAALQWLARSLDRHGGLKVRLELEPITKPLDPEIETVVFRIAQEALTNVLKYSGSERALLRLADDGRRVLLEVRDDGVGFDIAEVERGEGSGLRGIRDRVEIFGGQLVVDSSPGAGASISVRLPHLPSAGSQT